MATKNTEIEPFEGALVTYVCFDCADITLCYCNSTKQLKTFADKHRTGDKCNTCQGTRFYFHNQFKEVINVGK